MARNQQKSTTRVAVELIETGLDAKESEKQQCFLRLQTQLTTSTDPNDRPRIKKQLAKLTLGEQMPKIQWTDLPVPLREHLSDRLRERKIAAEDLDQKLWRESEPKAPEGLWYQDFGSFKICGEGKSGAA